MNRVRHKAYPDDVCAVVYQPFQFSWTAFPQKITESSQWQLAKEVATKILNGAKDFTNGSTHFHRTDIEVDWEEDKMKKTIELGGHQFYRLGSK